MISLKAAATPEKSQILGDTNSQQELHARSAESQILSTTPLGSIWAQKAHIVTSCIVEQQKPEGAAGKFDRAVTKLGAP